MRPSKPPTSRIPLGGKTTAGAGITGTPRGAGAQSPLLGSGSSRLSPSPSSGVPSFKPFKRVGTPPPDAALQLARDAKDEPQAATQAATDVGQAAQGVPRSGEASSSPATPATLQERCPDASTTGANDAAAGSCLSAGPGPSPPQHAQQASAAGVPGLEQRLEAVLQEVYSSRQGQGGMKPEQVKELAAALMSGSAKTRSRIESVLVGVIAAMVAVMMGFMAWLVWFLIDQQVITPAALAEITKGGSYL
ncbi:hypothetical protein GPECTOR_10g816 [Gonium pectorale]|uniref:Uncharacterized protein n=1 Tax=Gonium pectorale TaxID=33097 RepID=A0A150GQN7_GONPE|nr:hypothetical protein GPECTOR_10g816 [Gonium pectorale]|eukprot:KXZ52186.1 hypothetical protein GPECTOR_10g816 [Gonium pectorale]